MTHKKMFTFQFNRFLILFYTLLLIVFFAYSNEFNRIRITTRNGHIGYVNKDGALVIDTLYYSVDSVWKNIQHIKGKVKKHSDFNHCGIACVTDDSGIVMIDTNGHKLYRPFIFDNAVDEYSQGMARFTAENKFGFFDACGRIAIPAQYHFAQRFFGNRAVFSNDCLLKKEDEHTAIIGGKWGFIDKTGKIVIPPVFDSAENFENGYAKVVATNETFFIDTNGIRRTDMLKNHKDHSNKP